MLSDIYDDPKQSLVNVSMLFILKAEEYPHFIIILECLGKRILKVQRVLTFPVEAAAWSGLGNHIYQLYGLGQMTLRSLSSCVLIFKGGW